MTAQSNEAARHNVKVLVCGESGAPLQNARVIICDGSGRKVAQKLAGQNGPGLVIVAVPPGMYSATVSASGYESVNKDIKTSDTELDLGTVNLKVSDTLNAAKVVSKPLLRRTPDRYIYDVSRDSTAGKVSMMEMMPNMLPLCRSQRAGQNLTAIQSASIFLRSCLTANSIFQP